MGVPFRRWEEEEETLGGGERKRQSRKSKEDLSRRQPLSPALNVRGDSENGWGSPKGKWGGSMAGAPVQQQQQAPVRELVKG